ncbi:transmembrane protein KIAA1109 homolog tweek isoform X4 [Oratosquilla oratoria]|uniref:transmembrane protein KIAA1109 homolog tweek isoform X4 n=1 Tax=Oratosquilla oratoria TaxID=337810 RepID=UPI003F76D6C3
MALEGALISNNSVIKEIANLDPSDSSFLYLLLSVVLTMAWMIYVVLYNSRVTGCILTTICRRLVKSGNLSIGSFSFTMLSGKVMFRDIVYVTEDYTIRVVDGLLIFRYWLPYFKKNLSDDMSHCDHRVWIELNGPELHVYNRSNLYSNLENLFGLEPVLFGEADKKGSDEGGEGPNQSQNEQQQQQPKTLDNSFWESWRDLIPVIKVDLNMARFVFGNRHVASTLLLTMDKADCTYTTKPAACSLDSFMHHIVAKAENFRVILAPSPKYTGVVDDPPRYMGEGFVVLSSSVVNFYYYMDQPGLVPDQPQTMELPNGDVVTAPAPIWSLVIKCEKGTNFSYGPWADRQREQLFRFFYPQDYQKMQITKPQIAGEVRAVQQFDIRLSILNEATIDILFSKDHETNAVHMNVKRGSYFEMTLPWITTSSGYVTTINGQLLHVDASTSLPYRGLIEAETLDYNIAIHYPRNWNHHQTWDMKLIGSKATYHFLYAHKEFFQDMIEDWSSRASPDLFHFVPYTWNFELALNQFELVTLANEYNWVDCSSQHLANAHVAFCGDKFRLNFSLPFGDFLPETVTLNFIILGENVDLSLYLPPSNTTRNIITALDRNAKLIDREGRPHTSLNNDKWRKYCKLSAGWVDCWRVPELKLNVGYTYHPSPPLGPSPQANVSTPEKEELLLSPIRAPHKKKSPIDIIKTLTPEQFDPTSLTPDTFAVDLRIIEPSEIKLYGSVLRQFVHLKENIFGEEQKFTPMHQSHIDEDTTSGNQQDDNKSATYTDKKPEFDCRKYRPFEVTVNINIQNVFGHLMRDCMESDPACPTVAMDRLIFEMDKRYRETRLQVIVSPLILSTVDLVARPQRHAQLNQGFVMLTGLQMRGHAMFSSEERALDEETLEYAWLVELTVGSLTGKLTAPQLHHVVTAIETFVFTAEDSENCLRHPRPYHICFHGSPQPECQHTSPDHFCPTTDTIKYKMVRASIDLIDLHLVEGGTDMNLQVFPVRIATCNLHGQHTKSGVTAHIQNVRLHNYICGGQAGAKDSINVGSVGRGAEGASMSGLSGSGIGMMGSTTTAVNGDMWIEAGSVILGPLYIDAAISTDILHHDMQLIQHRFLKLHDQKSKRLWFLWPQEITKVPQNIYSKCGCVGGCAFFGSNRNGPRFFKPSKVDFYEGLNVAQYRVNDVGQDPGFGQSILNEGQLVLDINAYVDVIRCLQLSEGTDKDEYALSSGYAKSASPSDPQLVSVRTSSHHQSGDAHEHCRLDPRVYHREVSVTSQDSDPQTAESEPISRQRTSFDLALLSKVHKEVGLKVPAGEILSPGSLSDLRLSVDNVNTSSGKQGKMPSSLSLQTELPLHAAAAATVAVPTRSSENSVPESSSRQSLSSQQDFLSSVQRTVSIGSETLSEAFFSADEDQVTIIGSHEDSMSGGSSHVSIMQGSDDRQRHSSDNASLQCNGFSPLQRSSSGVSGQKGNLSKELTPSPCASRQSSGHHREHSQTSLLRSGSSGSTSSSLSLGSSKSTKGSYKKSPHMPCKEKKKVKGSAEETSDSSSEVASISSTSFISALSSQEDIALVDLHMQLNKPIIDSPLLMSSYINHMTQLRCQNWSAPIPSFSNTQSNNGEGSSLPYFEKLSEGFTAIRMSSRANGSLGQMPPRSPPPPSGRTPSHPYAWDTPVFLWGTGPESHEENKPEEEDIVGGVCDANTTRTTVVMKLKKEVDITLSPMVLDSAQLMLEAVTPVVETLHPLTIINKAHIQSSQSVEGQNTLKKERYMYWSRVRDKKAATPEQSAILSNTYQESCFQQIQGQISVPRVNITLLQASVVEEVISFSALDNVRDLTCVSLFSVCLDGVDLQFYAGHQSKKSVQMYMRNPNDPTIQKKGKLKVRQNVDLLSEPVYIETSERQQEETMVSVCVSKMHVQLRRLKNESVLLKDASITAIPNHRSKVLFMFNRASRDQEDEEDMYTVGAALEDERMGFIMFEAGLENVSLKGVKRKGFGQHSEEGSHRSDGNGPGAPAGCGGQTTMGSMGSTSAPQASSNGHGGNSAGIGTSGSGGGASSGGGSGPPSAEANRSNGESRKDTHEGSCSVSQMSNVSNQSGAAHSVSSVNGSSREPQCPQRKNEKKDITSFTVELKTVWFNFAAPPHTPITRKLDFTRLDWNLLSTASPSINAWMNPGDRLTVAVIQFLHTAESRRLGVMASLMAEALDVQSIHVPIKNKYVKLTPLSQTLQEDPSCQLCTVLRRYVLQSALKTIEANLTPPNLPKLATLRQGVVVLSRQWKNALYMPLLMEQSFKIRQARPTHAFRPHVNFEGRHSPECETLVEECEVTDEKTMLLNAEGGSLHSNKHLENSSSNSPNDMTEGVVSSGSTQLPPRKPLLPSYPPRSSRASVIFPILSNNFESPARFQMPRFGGFFRGNSRNNRNPSVEDQGAASLSSSSDRLSASSMEDAGGESSAIGTPKRNTASQYKQSQDDLYNWMVKQQEYASDPKHTVSFPRGTTVHTVSEGSGEERYYSPRHDVPPLQEPQRAHFIEAHVIFQPLLSAIGVIAQQVTVGALEQLGSNVSITAGIDTLRVDIIESEASKLNHKKRKTGMHQGNSVNFTQGLGASLLENVDETGKFFLDISSEVPAFLCERVGLEIDVSKVADDSREWVTHKPTLFVSRSALKQHTSTMVQFSLNVNYIAQQVNMPLLRLLHQITSMYQNARETQMGLREQRPRQNKDVNLSHHQKESSYSELHESEFKGAEYSISISEEQATVSSLGGIKGPRGSVVSSLSAVRTSSSPPPPSAAPPSSRLARPQSFAQKLRSSTKMGKGYMNLGGAERATGSPLFSISVSGSGLEGATICSSDKSPLLGPAEVHQTTPPPPMATPKCWRNIYYLLDLYTTTPETKTVQQRSSVIPDVSEGYKGSRKYDLLKETKAPDVEAGLGSSKPSSLVADKTKELGLISGERTPLVVFGLAKIQRTKLLATLSGLKLEAEMTAIHSSLTFREKVRGQRTTLHPNSRTTSELSLTGHIGTSMIVLLEGIAPNQQTVVRVTIGKSQGLYSSLSRKAKEKNSALITIGDINVDIPQHPVILHDMMTRGSKQLSFTLQELRVARPSARLSRGATVEEPDGGTASPRPAPEHASGETLESSHSDTLLNPLVIQFSILLQSLCIQAALLPSLQAQYRMEQVSSLGITGAKAKFNIHLSTHHLSFSTKLHDLPSESHLPSSASIELPQVHVEAEYLQDDASNNEQYADGVVLREGGYLSAVAEIGALEHCLTTDLLNHLVFVQKVFMKEVNEVVQKMAGGDKPVPLWGEEGPSHSVHPRRLLFTLQLRLKGIMITATTPTQSAVRLETGLFELQLSNRVENISGSSHTSQTASNAVKLFGKAQVDINVALGQLIRNEMFEEAEPEFQKLAFFKTRICLRNAFHNETGSVDDGEVVLIRLIRPLVCVQPLAVDRAVLVWLNYKNAYEYWSDQRASLNKEVLTATQQVFEKVPQFSTLSSAAHIKNNLYLQLTVDDIGVCLPLNPCRSVSKVSHQVVDTETRDAVVVTLESTIISACNSGSLVCKARFKGFCMRFAPEFETSLDDWKPNLKDQTIMNLCTVSEGTYEVCSRTVAKSSDKAENAKWFLNVQWQMEGVDLHFDVTIGKHLSALARTLTMLTGAPDTGGPQGEYDSDDADEADGISSQESALTRRQAQFNASLPAFIYDPNLDARQRAKLLEIEMNEQAKTVNDLKTLGASASTIEQEMRRLQELEAVVFHDFRRDMIKRLRRQSVKATSMRDRLGLGQKTHLRSKSFKVPSPTIEVKEPSLSVSAASSERTSLSVEGSPSHGSITDTSGPRVKFAPGRHSSLTSGSSDSNPTDEVDMSDVFVPSINGRTPTPPEATDTDTITFNTLSTEVANANECNGDAVTTPSPLGKKSISSGSGAGNLTPGAPSAPSSVGSSKPQDQTIDLELDVKVCISSGECVLYNKDFAKEEDSKRASSNDGIIGRLKKERSFSGGMADVLNSPGSLRRKNEMRHNLSSSKIRQPQATPVSTATDFTIFCIPGLDVKVHYESHNHHEESPVSGARGGSCDSTGWSPTSGLAPTQASAAPLGTAGSTGYGGASGAGRKGGTYTSTSTGGTKRASLFTWLTLQSIPDETIISPNILEFLEQALEPIPLPEPHKPTHENKDSSEPNPEPDPVFNVDLDTSASVGGPGVPYAYASFPVDVIVYFHMQPSMIRFSCQPVSRVECLLQLPSLNLVFSSKRAEGEPTRVSVSALQATIGGLSVTGVLADFSLFVFHPYGGKQRGQHYGASSMINLLDNERKDSLSVMVEFVKFHITRSRKINFNKPEGTSKLKQPSGDSTKAIIRFSTIIDIGAAHFKYDMRRLTEILAFPKAWYRRSIVRRLFLGDFSGGAAMSEGEESSPNSSTGESPATHNPPTRLSTSSTEGNDVLKRDFGHSAATQPAASPSTSTTTSPTTSTTNSTGGPGSKAREKLRLNLHSDVPLRKGTKMSGEGTSASTSTSNSNQSTSSAQQGLSTSTTANKSGSWETLVLFAVNFTKLNVHMNMGNVMGNVVWTTKDFKADGRLSIGSTGHKNMYIGIGLGGSVLDAKGGIVGGTIELAEINMYLKIREDTGMEPDHVIGLKLFASQSRLDYMGTSVLMGRVSSFAVNLRDEWKLKQCSTDDDDTTRRGATIFILGDLEWDQLQLMISKSTTADLLKMYHKLEEFFSQQFKSSKRVFSSLQPTRHKSSVKHKQRDSNKKIANVLGVPYGQDARHHRHWQGVLHRVSGLKLTTLPQPLPVTGTLLGGSMELHGKTISLACFHGINFKSKSWALFSLKEPFINFMSEVQDIPGDPPRDPPNTHIVQHLAFSLGLMEQTHAQHVSMATVCRITRNMVFPPQFRTVQEWFHYAFCTSELDNVDRFPVLDGSRSDSLPSEGKRTSRLQDHNHSTETIFALPSMQINLSSKHLQTGKTPDFMDEKPKVECALVTEFQDHIFVTVDAENFFFLHDLIASYVKDTKEKLDARAKPDSKVKGEEQENKADGEKKPKVVRVNEPTQLLQQDWREFTCTTWHLEPTVRLLSWATKNLEPYGVDYILHKLGFSHARVTIPKWLQRGCMDPLDKVLSVLMYRMVTAIQDHDHSNK